MNGLVPRVLAGILAVALAAFLIPRLISGDEGNDRDPVAELAITHTIDAVSTSGDPSYCDELVTDAYLKQETGEDPPFADEACEDQAPIQPARSAEVRKIEVDGGTATAEATFEGGSASGTTVRMGLVEEDGVWKVDRLLAIVDLDREKLRAAYRRNFIQRGFPARAADCVLAREAELSEAEVKAALLAGPRGTFVPMIIACDRRRVEDEALETVASPKYGLPAAAVSCVRRGLRSQTDAELAHVFSPVDYGTLVIECDPHAFTDLFAKQLRESGAGEDVVACFVGPLGELSPAGQMELLYDEAKLKAQILSCTEEAPGSVGA